MNAEAWESCQDPTVMIKGLLEGGGPIDDTDPMGPVYCYHEKATERKLRLFIIACGRNWSFGDYKQSQKILDFFDIHEKYADGRITYKDFQQIHNEYFPSAGFSLVGPPDEWFEKEILWTGISQEKTLILLREIFGNPWESFALWNIPLPVRAFATMIYDFRHFQDMPVLGDMCEEFGCPDVKLLAHLRSPKKHFLGCAALDFLAGKS